MTTTAITDGEGEAPSGASFVLPLDPVPASRPRVTRWGTYIAKPYSEWLKAAGECLRGVAYRAPERHLAVTIESVSKKARTSKLTTPRYDIDNAVKGVMDAITHAGIWPDDKWVVQLNASKRFADPGEDPHTRVEIEVVE